jgi:hypothetical protein
VDKLVNYGLSSIDANYDIDYRLQTTGFSHAFVSIFQFL